MIRMKYIMTRYSPIVFSDALNHRDVSSGWEVTSAGFVSVEWNEEEKKFNCVPYGESVSLGLKPDTEDKLKLERMFNGGYS